MQSDQKSGSDELALEGNVSPEDARLFHDLVRRRFPLPDGFRTVKFRFGEDSAGDPAVWIVFIVEKDDLSPSRERIAEIRRAGEAMKSEVRRTGTERWPYIAMETG